jgi:hypothetical protein
MSVTLLIVVAPISVFDLPLAVYLSARGALWSTEMTIGQSREY